MTELVLPVALWNGPPLHSITSILLLQKSTLITGSRSGQLCLWLLDIDKVWPTALMLLHNHSFQVELTFCLFRPLREDCLL